MAKDNLFLGMGRGSVGDVTFYRANGEQIARARNRRPKNPRSNAQQYQRAVLATVSQAYSAGRTIFDHSFQGESVGAFNQRAFLKVNLDYLRERLASDVQNDVTDPAQATFRAVAPGATMPVPNSYIVSRGTYDQNLMSVHPVNGVSMPAPTEGETIADYCRRNNIIEGDIYTIVAFVSSETIAAYQSAFGIAASSPACRFLFLRLTVKPNITTSTSTIALWSNIFDMDQEGVSQSFAFDSLTLDNSILISDLSGDEDFSEGSIGVIRSRKDMDLRSNSQLLTVSKFGILGRYVLSIWQNSTTQVGDSDLILEGGGF